MRITKWIFFGYVALVLAIVATVALSFAMTPPRDPHTLYSAYPANIKTLDPPEVTDTVAHAIAGQIFECLYNYKYGVQPYELFPELASAFPEVSPDGKTVTIQVRKGIRFYDPDKAVFPDGAGPEITAADFVYSWKRMADFHLASPNYSAIFEGKIAGIDEWAEYTKTTPAAAIDWDRPVEGLTALDDRTIQIQLTSPYPQLRYNLAHMPTAVVCRKAVEKYGEKLRKHPVGSGPYSLRFADHLEEQRIVFFANPIYRGRPDIEGNVVLPEAERLPRIKRLQYDYFNEPVPVWLLFQKGLFDIGGIPKESYHQAIRVDSGELTEEMTRKGIRLVKSPDPSVYYFGFNWTDPVVGRNRALRQAMSMAFDRKTHIDTFLNGRGLQPIGLIPPGFPTYDPDAVNPYTRYDLKAAREKLAEAERFQGGPIPPLKLLLGDTDTGARQEADFFVSQMAKIGLTVSADYATWARFLDMVDHRQAQVFSLGWLADYPDEQTFLQLFYGKNAPPGGVNPTGYVNPEFDALYERAVVMDPSPERDALYKRMCRIADEDCAWLYSFYPLKYTLHYDWVKNIAEMDYGSGMRQFLVLDEEGRRRRLAGR